MKKNALKLLCLTLSLLTVCGVLASCSNKSSQQAQQEIVNKASKATTTLSLYLMSETEVSAEQEKKIEDAVNKLTKAKYKTQLDLRYVTADEYYAALEKAFTDYEADKKARDEAKKAQKAAEKEAKKNGTAVPTTKVEEEEPEEELILNEYGIPEAKYPEITDFQVDIFYLGGFDNFLTFKEKNWLSRLDDELSSGSKMLKTYVSPVLLSAVKDVSNGTYFIPNAKALGEYSFLLLNKEVMAQYNYSAEDGNFTSLTAPATKSLLELVATYNTDMTPLYSSVYEDGGLEISNVHYFGFDENGNFSNDFSLLGGSYNAESKYYPNSATLNDTEFNSQLNTLIGYREKGYYNAPAEDADFAVGYVKGGYEIYDQYGEDYQIVMVESPMLTAEAAYENGFCVGAYTSSVSRSMDIVTYINTDEEIRNILLYGIEEENYEFVHSKQLDADGKPYDVVRLLSDAYVMDVKKTGNELIAFPKEGDDPRASAYAKMQNLDASAVLCMKFVPNLLTKKINKDAMAKIAELSAFAYEKLCACTNAADLSAALEEIRVKRESNDYFAFYDCMINADYSSTNASYEEMSLLIGEGDAFAYAYRAWLVSNKFISNDE